MDPTTLAGRYRLEALLGTGGMGTVHAAFDLQLERRVAIKTLPRDIEADPLARARFRREALAAAALDHPYICKIHEVGEDRGRSFIVMECVEGQTLDAVIASGGLPPRRLIGVAHELAQALDEAHRRGIVHRDLKPSNVMLTVQGHVKVLDFGLAKQAWEAETVATAATAIGITQPGTRLGTPAYMSPEQVLGSPLDPRSDIFALGVVLYELACGRHPFAKETPADTMASILRDVPPATETDLDVVPGLGRIVHRMLAKACAERCQSMSDVADELDALRERASTGTPGSGSSTPAATRAERTVLVARDAELTELSGHLDRMLLGAGGMVLLGGEPGVGKTRLARELQRLAHNRGCVALTGQCYEQEGSSPFGPFVESMEQAARAFPQAMRASLGDLGPELALMVPELRRLLPGIPDAPTLVAEQQRRVLFNAYLTYVRAATAKSAAVLLLDDLQWADESSVQLLSHVAPHLGSMRLLVVGTYRDVDLDAKRPFARVFETLVRQRLATRISVRRLHASAVKQMIATMSGSAPPESFAAAVHEQTEGNPFFVEEVFHHLKEDGKLFDDEGRWRAAVHVGDVDVPEGVRLVISRRLERLGTEARKVLTAGAVIGRSFPLDVLQAVTGADEEAVLDALDDAVRAQLLQMERTRAARYSFVHELIRTTLLTDLALPRRQRLHVRVAEAIERRGDTAVDSSAAMLAHHLYQAGAAVDQDRAIRAISTAMLRARDAGAFEEALTLADQLLSFDLDPDGEAIATVESVRAYALVATGALADAQKAAERLLSVAVKRGDHASTAEACQTLARVVTWSGDVDRGLAAAKAAMTSIPPGMDRARAVVLSAYANLLISAGDAAGASAAAAESLASAERLDDADALAWSLSVRAMTFVMIGRNRDAQPLLDRVLALLGDSRHYVIGTAVLLKGSALPLGGIDELEAFFERGEGLSSRAGHSAGQWLAANSRQHIALMRAGDVRAFREAADRQWARGLPGFVGKIALSDAAMAALYCGDVDRAAVLLERSLENIVGLMPTRDQANLLAAYAWNDRAADALEVWRTIEDAVVNARSDEQHWHGLGALHASAAALPLIGQRDACAALYPALNAVLALGFVSSIQQIGPTSPYLAAGIAAECKGLVEAAYGHYEKALALAHEVPDRLLQPAARMWFGRFLAASAGDRRPRGLTMLREAAVDFARLGMPLHAAKAEQWLAGAER